MIGKQGLRAVRLGELLDILHIGGPSVYGRYHGITVSAEFSMEDMAEMLNMSRSNFYRKIKGVLDLTPNEYLRIERLKRAAQLLKDGENRVNEICYMVGFNSPSYFSKCFLKQFGVLPKDFVD